MQTLLFLNGSHVVLKIEGDTLASAHSRDTVDALDEHLTKEGLQKYNDLFNSATFHGADDSAGGLFNWIKHKIVHAFHAIKHGIEDAWSEVTHSVIETWSEVQNNIGQIVHEVEVAIVTAEKSIFKWVIRTVNNLVGHITEFLKKIWVGLKEVYQFLRAMFSWTEILETQKVIKAKDKLARLFGLDDAQSAYKDKSLALLMPGRGR